MHSVGLLADSFVVVASALLVLVVAILALLNRRLAVHTAALQDAERQRERSQVELARLASFPEFDPSPVLETDLLGNLTYHNAAAAERFPSLVSDGGDHSALSRVARAIARLQQGSDNQVLEETHIDGKSYELRVSLSSTRDRAVIYCTDITDRLRAAEALRTQERFLRSIIDANPSLIYLKDAEGRIILANRAFAALYGTTPALVLGRREDEFLDPKLAIGTRLSDDKVRTTQTTLVLADEQRRDPRTGGQRWYQIVKLPLTIPDEGMAGVLSIANDITDRRAAEWKLLEDARRLAATLEIQQTVGSWSHDPGEMRRAVVERARALTRATGAAILLIEGDRLVLESGSGTAAEHVGLTVCRASRLTRMWASGGEVLQIQDTERELALNRTACKVLHIRSAVVVGLQSGGKLIGALAVTSTKPKRFTHHDVQGMRLVVGLLSEAMARAAAAAANAEMEARFRTLADAVPVMIWTSDEHDTCDYFNRHLLEFTGRTLVKELAADWSADLHPEDAAACIATIGEALRNRVPYQLEYRRRRHDGVYRLLQDVAVPRFTPSGAFCGYAGTCRDITDRRDEELALRQALKLEAIGSLAAGIAHEINTPVQYVSDNVRFLQSVLVDLLDVVRGTARAQDLDLEFLAAEAPLAADQAVDGLRRIADIVRAVKQFSHPGSDRPAPADLNAEITTTAAVSRNEWRYVADLTTRLDPDLPLVPCLADEIRQVLLNLIVNAAHAIAEAVDNKPGARGTIEVVSRRDGDWAEITVSDTGTGIPEAVRARIFDPFFTTKAVGHGTGQGLAIARAIVVEKHRGVIRFDTIVGHGTTFIVRLPLQGPADGKARAA
jgi:PAS domain S-box-containing protein